MDTVCIGRTVVATLFMDILKGKDLLCWQRLIVILSCFYLPPIPPRHRFSFLRPPGYSAPLSLHSDTNNVGAYFSEKFCSPARNLRLIRMTNSALHNPVMSQVFGLTVHT